VSKSPRVYLLVLVCWLAIMVAAAPAMIGQIQTAAHAAWYITAATVLSALFIAYFWLNGVKDIVYTLHYHLVDRHLRIAVPRRANSADLPRVVLVYCTCNDFSDDSLLRSMRQDYPNYETVILDDSWEPAYVNAVDQFVAEHGVRVVRRPDRTGFKAGNLNNFLRAADFDYFVILDSDEIIPPDYIGRSLDYFEHYENTGIVQANHVATRNRNAFMHKFAAGVDSHWIAYQTVKNRYGFLSLLGHGAMVSRECYEAANGFPHVVSEDLCFSIVARDQGYYTAFAPDIRCEEEFPVNFLAFKKRHSKWTQGNMEFIKKYTGFILRCRMHWFEKLDIFMFAYGLPLTSFFSLYVVIHVILLPALGYSIVYPLWMLIPTVAFLLAPMLNDVIFHCGRMRPAQLLSYLGHSVLLYGSMFFLSLRTSATSAFGGSTFIVTPKADERTTVRQALTMNRSEMAFGVGLAAVSLWLTNSVLPVLLIIGPAVLCSYLALKHNDDHGDAVEWAAPANQVALPRPRATDSASGPAPSKVAVAHPNRTTAGTGVAFVGASRGPGRQVGRHRGRRMAPFRERTGR
jgi:cellulose synthase/poly-beta-1,6-N-acetylglucosamine synthase-like glycosyltransferase